MKKVDSARRARIKTDTSISYLEERGSFFIPRLFLLSIPGSEEWEADESIFVEIRIQLALAVANVVDQRRILGVIVPEVDVEEKKAVFVRRSHGTLDGEGTHIQTILETPHENALKIISGIEKSRVLE